MTKYIRTEMVTYCSYRVRTLARQWITGNYTVIYVNGRGFLRKKRPINCVVLLSGYRMKHDWTRTGYKKTKQERTRAGIYRVQSYLFRAVGNGGCWTRNNRTSISEYIMTLFSTTNIEFTLFCHVSTTVTMCTVTTYVRK